MHHIIFYFPLQPDPSCEIPAECEPTGSIYTDNQRDGFNEQLSEGKYLVERLITVHKRVRDIYIVSIAKLDVMAQGSTKEYFVLWKNWPIEFATWEPERNIEDSLIRYTIAISIQASSYIFYSAYNNPSPPDHIVKHHVALFSIEINRSLKTGCLNHTEFRIPFRFDVFKFLFNDYNKIDAILTQTSTLLWGGMNGYSKVTMGTLFYSP